MFTLSIVLRPLFVITMIVVFEATV